MKDAFHPLIQLGYGIEFNVTTGIASGPAYLTIIGDDPQLAAIAARPPEIVALPATQKPPVLPFGMLFRSNDEHDIKIVYSALRQSQAFGDAAFVQAAVRYLARV